MDLMLGDKDMYMKDMRWMVGSLIWTKAELKM